MCVGAILNARIAKVYYGARDDKAGALGSVYDIGRDGRLNHRIEVYGGILAEECAALLRDFFRDAPADPPDRATHSDLQENFARAFDRQFRHRAHTIAELRQRREFARADVDQHREDRELQFVFALAQIAEPFGRHLAFAVGDHHDIAALELLVRDQFDRRVDRRLKVGAAAGKVFGQFDHLGNSG